MQKPKTKSSATKRTTVGPVPKVALKTKPKGVAKPTTKPASAAKPAGKARLPKLDADTMFSRMAAKDPEPRSDLEYQDPYTLLVAVVLSAQATDAGVNKATRVLFAKASTPAAMVALGEDAVREEIKTIGLFRNKAKNVVALSQQLIDEHDGAVPQTREALEQLPGVGRKTANVVVNIAFGVPAIAVDTHVFRVANRTGLAPGKDPLAVELALEKAVPAAFLYNAHHWLILHGRYVCVARKPRCAECIIADLCQFPEKTGAS
jgi:endonuclease III